jgi:ornithine cyclodeaminase/alanine dehydrogenase-like protein (mu-crystallin family)
MPAALAGGRHWSVKVVTVAPGNPAKGLPLVAASVLLGDAATGTPLALLDGTSLTALRTGAAGGVAARALARSDSEVIALFGAGAQARAQLEAVLTALGDRVREVRIASRNVQRAVELAKSAPIPTRVAVVVQEAPGDIVRGADVVITATSSSTPVFSGSDLDAGVHVTAVGSFKPTMRELDEATVRGARVVVDQREPALAEAGELQGLRPDDVVEIGEVVAGTVPGRRDASERTLFKSVGNAVQDLVVASRVYERALEMGLGEEIRWP